MRFSKAVVKYRIPILILTVFLMIPAVIGIANTRINYDMLNYLPEDMDTIIGQNELMEDFGKGAFSFIIVEDMPNKDVATLKAKIEQVDHVDTVIWLIFPSPWSCCRIKSTRNSIPTIPQ